MPSLRHSRERPLAVTPGKARSPSFRRRLAAVIPAKAGIHFDFVFLLSARQRRKRKSKWIPAFAGMTEERIPAFAGITEERIPACAWITEGWIPAFAAMTTMRVCQQ